MRVLCDLLLGDGRRVLLVARDEERSAARSDHKGGVVVADVREPIVHVADGAGARVGVVPVPVHRGAVELALEHRHAVRHQVAVQQRADRQSQPAQLAGAVEQRERRLRPDASAEQHERRAHALAARRVHRRHAPHAELVDARLDALHFTAGAHLYAIYKMR